jgi:hypothetical protein
MEDQQDIDNTITSIMKLLENNWYIDTDWRSEETFNEDYRPVIAKMIKECKVWKYE